MVGPSGAGWQGEDRIFLSSLFDPIFFWAPPTPPGVGTLTPLGWVLTGPPEF